MRHPRLAIIAALAVTLAAQDAYGEIWHLKSPSKVETEKGSKLDLPPGYFLDEVTWQERDLELRRLQELETRLVAENKSLRDSADFPPWQLVAAGGLGIAVGVLVMVLQ